MLAREGNFIFVFIGLGPLRVPLPVFVVKKFVVFKYNSRAEKAGNRNRSATVHPWLLRFVANPK